MLSAALAALALVPTPGASMEQMIPYARSVWHDAPSAQTATIVRRYDMPDIGDGYYAAGLAYLDQARIEVDGNLRGATLCTVLVHELGHFARGPGHSLKGVMRAEFTDLTYGCKRRFGTRTERLYW